MLRSGRYPGLKNLGHTCYINSCIQSLLFTPQFLESLQVSHKHLIEVPLLSDRLGTSSYGHLVGFLREFVQLLSKMRSFSEPHSPQVHLTPDPYKFIQSLSLINPEYGPRSGQQDVQEFFVFLLCSLDDLITVTRKSIQEKQNAASLEACRFFIEPKEPSQEVTETNTSITAPSISFNGTESVNSKKRPAEPPTPDTLLPISSTPLIHSREASLDAFALQNEAKRPKRSEVDTISSHSLAISENSLMSVDRTILPESQDIAKEFELTYEAPSQDLIFASDSNPPSLDMEMSLPSVSELPPLPKTGSILDFLPPAEPVATKSAHIGFPHSLFQGEVRSTFQCLECERESGPAPEGFFDISLAIQENKDLYWSLNNFFAKSTLRGKEKYDCSECKILNEAHNYTRITKLPNILTLHLKRFSWNNPDFGAPSFGPPRRAPLAGSKLTFHVSCPDELSIPRGWLSTQYLQTLLPGIQPSTVEGPISDSLSKLESLDSLNDSLTGSRALSKSVLHRTAEDTAAKYELYSIIYHVGASTSSGHYTCCVKLPPNSESSVLNEPTWVYFDDQNVHFLTHARVMHTISEHPAGGATAYILLYRLLESPPQLDPNAPESSNTEMKSEPTAL